MHIEFMVFVHDTLVSILLFFFFFNDTATTEIYTLSLHDALPISVHRQKKPGLLGDRLELLPESHEDRKSTRLNSSHGYISYAVFCLKKKKNIPGVASYTNQAQTSISSCITVKRQRLTARNQ